MKEEHLISSESTKLQTSAVPNNVITYTAKEKLKVPRADAFNVKIESHTFDNGIGTITFAGEVTTIGEYAFAYCSGLTSIDIPDSVTKIGKSAFEGCDNLPIIDGIRYADTYLVKAVENQSSYNIKDGTRWIGERAFEYCKGLTSITIPDSVTEIGERAFFNCKGLTSIDIPNSVTEIGCYAFKRCKGLESITCHATKPPILDETCFEEVSPSIPIYVPDEAVDAYKNADGWKAFENILPISAKE